MKDATHTLTPQQLAAVETVLARYQGKGRSALLPCLHEVQAITGWLDPEICAAIGQSLRVPLVQIHEVIEFYTLFYNRPVGRRIIRVCDDVPCYLAGSEAIIRACATRLRVDEGGGTTEDGAWTLEIHPCLGRCEQAPFLMIDDEGYGHVTPEQIADLLGGKP